MLNFAAFQASFFFLVFSTSSINEQDNHRMTSEPNLISAPIEKTVNQYLNGQTAPLSFRHSTWEWSHIDRENNQLSLSNTETPSRSNFAGYISSINQASKNLAIVRAENFTDRQSLVLVLLENEGKWHIVSEVLVADKNPDQQSHPFNHLDYNNDILALLKVYYDSVNDGNPEPLFDLFHDNWRMRNHADDKIVSEDKAAFIKRIEGRDNYPGYSHDRQISQIQFLYNRFAVVQVDRPSTPVTVFFFFIRTETGWKMTEKIFP